VKGELRPLRDLEASDPLALPELIVRFGSNERGRGQFLQACEAEALQERSGRRKAKPPVGTANSSTSFRSRSFTTRPRLLLKGDAGEHFECRGREIKTPACSALFA
jgi:hypothetical protein